MKKNQLGFRNMDWEWRNEEWRNDNNGEMGEKKDVGLTLFLLMKFKNDLGYPKGIGKWH